jgi:hypothetical protein
VGGIVQILLIKIKPIMKPNPNEQVTCETPAPIYQPTTWADSDTEFNINDAENNDKLTILAEAGF